MQTADWVVIEGHDDRARDERDTDAQEDVVSALYWMRDSIYRYPMVVQAVFSFLVAEGRRFAETEEGEQLRNRLMRSPSSASARMIWELLTTHAFVEKPVHALPSAFIERFVRLVATRGIEPLISRIFEGGHR
jgi:hypothetical protein